MTGQGYCSCACISTLVYSPVCVHEQNRSTGKYKCCMHMHVQMCSASMPWFRVQAKRVLGSTRPSVRLSVRRIVCPYVRPFIGVCPSVSRSVSRQSVSQSVSQSVVSQSVVSQSVSHLVSWCLTFTVFRLKILRFARSYIGWRGRGLRIHYTRRSSPGGNPSLGLLSREDREKILYLKYWVVGLSVCPLVSLPVCLSACPPVCLSWLSDCLPVRLSACLDCLTICLSACLSACLSVCLGGSLAGIVCMSVCMHACMSVCHMYVQSQTNPYSAMFNELSCQTRTCS